MGSVEDVRERLSIEQVVGEVVELKRAGSSLKGRCPFHQEKTPSFYVTPSKGIYKCFGCLPPGQFVKTEHGMRPIEEIKVGDLVYTDKGRLRPVLLTHEHMFAGELVKLVCAPYKVPILLTPNHKVPVLRPRSKKRVEIEAGSIRPQNHLIYPSISRETTSLSWNVRPEWKKRYKIAPKALPASVNVDLFAEWLGWYIAEGSVSNDRTVRFSLCADEMEQAQRLQRLTSELFGCTLEIRLTKGHSLETWFCHTLLSRWLKHHCGAGARNKHLPGFVWSWNPQQQWTLFHALMMGDGRIRPGNTTNRGVVYPPGWTFVTSSATLADDVRDLLLANGVSLSSMKEGRGSTGRPAWYLSMNPAISEMWGIQQEAQRATSVRVQKVEPVPYHGPVYNLTVAEDHTYVTMSGAVCNCGESGDVFTFVMKTRNMDFRDALELLAGKAGVTLDEPDRAREQDSVKTRIYDMNAAAATYYQAMLQAGAGAPARAYLERRAISAESISRFGLGYAPETRDGLCARLRGMGYADEDVVAAGLAIAPDEGGPIRDSFRGRLMFPIRDRKGHILGFGGRTLGDGQPKYLNTRGTDVFEKSRVLYAIEHAEAAIRGAKEVVVVEGYVDALRAHQEGFANVVATLGTAITEQNLHALSRLTERIVLALDADPAGQRAAVKAGLAALETLPRKTSGATGGSGAKPARIYVATLPEGQDPDDAIKADPDVWRNAVAEAVPLMDHYFALVVAGLDHAQPEWKQEAVDALVPEIGKLDGLGLQQSYIDQLAELTGIDARYLRDITPGAFRGAGRSSGRGARRAVSAATGEKAAPPPAADPVRVTEEYLVGLLLAYRPLAPEVRAEVASYRPQTGDLARLFAALAAGQDPDPDDEDTVERLIAAMQQRPPLDARQVAAEVRVAVTRANEERVRRDILDMGRVLADVDRDTAREMASRASETLVLKWQLTTRLEREQTQRWRRQDTGESG